MAILIIGVIIPIGIPTYMYTIVIYNCKIVYNYIYIYIYILNTRTTYRCRHALIDDYIITHTPGIISILGATVAPPISSP